MSSAAKMKASLASAKAAAAEVIATGAPRSVLSIPSSVRNGPLSHIQVDEDGNKKIPGAVVRQMGAMRRVFLLNPTLTKTEMHGLAYRIKLLGKNTTLNSILISNTIPTDDDDRRVMPASVNFWDREVADALDDGLSPRVGVEAPDGSVVDGVWHAYGGYNARSVSDWSTDAKEELLDNITNLAQSIKGQVPNKNPSLFKTSADDNDESQSYISKIPTISVPHGLITDAGYALAMSSYALATDDSQFMIQNPLKGLALDPIGLSYILPRVGMEYSPNQPSAEFSKSIAKLLALAGYKADAMDLVETGLCTHYFGSFDKMVELERSLTGLKGFANQGLMKKYPELYGDIVTGGRYGDRKNGRNQRNQRGRGSPTKRPARDINAKFRNMAVANVVEVVSEYNASGQDMAPDARFDELELLKMQDPSTVLSNSPDEIHYLGDRESRLLNIAATFQHVFEEDGGSVEGILERMKEYASQEATDEEGQECADIAQGIVDSIEARSPLAVKAVSKLLEIGGNGKNGKEETLESCMDREKRVQMKLMEGEDFKSWAKSGLEAGEFKGWKHSSLKEVTSDEVEELFGK